MKFIFGSVAIVILLSTMSVAQTRFGATAGVNFSSFGAPDAKFYMLQLPDGRIFYLAGPKTRIGVAFGFRIKVPLKSNHFDFAPELVYSQLGASYDFDYTEYYYSTMLVTRGVLEKHYDYIQGNALLQYCPNPQSKIRFVLYAGPTVGYLVHSAWNFDVSTGSMPDSSGPAQFPTMIEIGAMFGGGLSLSIAGHELDVTLRYARSVNSVDDSQALLEIKNISFQARVAILY